jgi:type IV secretion system protein VirB9
MPQVTFIYPDEERNKWDLYRNHATKERQDKTIPETGDYLEKR